MENCIFCGKKTSFIFEGDGEYHGKHICPKCQADKMNTTFLGCSNKERCSLTIKRENPDK
ncbi:MAG: hypothetical protein ACTSQP_11725 [Promethearchaeota archaeon]